MHAPLFWKHKTKLSSALLPFASAYGFVAGLLQTRTEPLRLPVPVICIGNVIVGGSGKTPVALAVGKLLQQQGKQAHYLSRGYKGRLKGPVKVDPSIHSAADVGDEALLLARQLPTWVSADRIAGAKSAIAAGAELIIMDDGFQNPALHKDAAFLVIDGSYGFGNGRLLPAGPLREPPAAAFARADAVIFMDEDRHGLLALIPQGLPVLRASIEPLPEAQALSGKAVLAFAGIARPRKFYRTLQTLGAQVRKMVAYPDHYAFKARDLKFLRDKARELEAQLVTTEKDHVRLPPDLRAEVIAVPVHAVFADETSLLAIVIKS